ncbi:hypothetical protein RD055328_08310 [Companilactobacillus sp. RD055328]|uniref:phage tail protein n=1 Tax=Companilactobacillus sp. RD055328 TaxID=2916634 RepID=UPI001FC8298A|nr:phage tail protein [Companilactobacillus sp. RD055328]GKQ42908.1 hypothetical protein RD055328_08310 [Companilactobacillus sp. RD055328]
MKVGGVLAEYNFRDLNKYEGKTEIDGISITEGFKFAEFNSLDNDLYLIERDAPTPPEKEITESIAYMQGNYDFSIIDNERYFNNRDLTFKLTAFKMNYPDRKILENKVKSALMPFGKQQIYDTHNQNMYWFGKCKSVSVEDNQDKNTLSVTIVFDCYPFAIYEYLEGNDVWDIFNFTSDISQKVDFEVNGNKEIVLINNGSHRSELLIVVDGDISINGIPFKTGEYKDTQIVLNVGINNIKLSGKGSVSFNWRKELMV